MIIPQQCSGFVALLNVPQQDMEENMLLHLAITLWLTPRTLYVARALATFDLNWRSVRGLGLKGYDTGVIDSLNPPERVLFCTNRVGANQVHCLIILFK